MSGVRHMHLCLDIRGAIQGTGWKCVTSPDGREVTKAQAVEWLMDRLAEGKSVLPIGGPCEGFDYQKGCPGHEDATAAAAAPIPDLEDASRSPAAAPPTEAANHPLPTPVETSQTPSLGAGASASEQQGDESGGPFEPSRGPRSPRGAAPPAPQEVGSAQPTEGGTGRRSILQPHEGPTTSADDFHAEKSPATEASHALVPRERHSLTTAPGAGAAGPPRAARKRLDIRIVGTDGSETRFDPGQATIDYEAFIASKRLIAQATGIDDPPNLTGNLFPFQADIVRWALRRGRAAAWADCGLGKTRIALEWARVVSERAGDVLILTPLAVAQQFVAEGETIGVRVNHVREVEQVKSGITVTNYERLARMDVRRFAAIVADESSILKDYTSSTRNTLVEAFAQTPFRLALSATPAPNDHMELGNHAEFLGVMSRAEMLAMFFTHDGGSTQDWRLKGHARSAFWRWVSSWAVAIRKPSDLGYSDDGYALPPLNVHEIVVKAGDDFRRQQGGLFVTEARGLTEQRQARRSSLADRVKATAEIVNAEPSESWIVWCDLNDESKALVAAIPGAVEVCGSDAVDDKEARLAAFSSGDIRVLVSKPSIAGHGLNWQHCARTAFVGLSHSFEAWYQAVRRNYRFGQKRPVECYVVTGEAEGSIVANLKRKQAEAAEMMAALVGEMREFNGRDVGAAKRDVTVYEPQQKMLVPDWIGKEAP